MQRLPVILCVVAAALFATPAHSASWPQPLADYFADLDSCILIYEQEADLLTVQNPERCALPLSPCSTFKIPNALIGLETGVLSGPTHEMKWDGKERWRKITNRDHDLASAIRHSIVWYFQAVARAIGNERMQQYVDRLEYGNRDISGGIDRFWLSNSLKINAYQQLAFLQQLKNGELPVAAEAQEQVRNLLLLRTDVPGMVRGKTGSCRSEAFDHGWFVGWLVNDGHTTFFVTNFIAPDAFGSQAQPLVYNILKQMQP